MPRVAEQIADWLVARGVEQVFAVTGGGAMFLNQALGGHPGLRCTFMHHEQACAIAAEGYARVTGRPAVVLVTTGPGATNALTGVFGAYTDSIPMLVISGQIRRQTCLAFHPDLPLRQLGDQEGPAVAMATPVCKLARLVREPEELVSLLPLAYREATTGRPGPVWLDIPLDIQQADLPLALPAPAPRVRPANGLASEAVRQACRTIVERLVAADRPLILAGTGVRLAGVEARLLALIERIGVPLATAWTHDLIPSDHPLFAGRPGTIGTRAGNFVLQAADCLLVLGSRLNIRQTSYQWEAFARDAWIAQVDIDGAELRKPTVQPDLGVEADLVDFLPILEEELARVTLPRYTPWVTWCQRIGARYPAIAEHRQAPDRPLAPYLLVDRIFRALRDDDIVVCGNASACILPFQVGTLRTKQRLFSNSGAASMGYDLPAALGAAAAVAADRSRRRVICFAGDGSLQMNIQELQTLQTAGWSVLVIVLNNQGYLSIRQTHENFFGRVIGATPASGVGIPNFAAIATAYGLRAVAITSPADLPRLDTILNEDGPVVIECHVDPAQEFIPRLKSRVDAEGRFVTPELDDMFPFLPEQERDAVRAEGRAQRAVRADAPEHA